MVPIRKILAPIDFTDACRATARFAVALAPRCHADVTVLHVLEPVGSAVGLESPAMFEQSIRSRREHMCRQLEGFPDADSDQQVRRVLLDGDPATEIVRFAHIQGIDLIMMPTRGYGAFRRLLLGSVTAKVLHDAVCPVWTGVHPEALDASGDIAFRTIACAVDLGPQTRNTLGWAADFASHWGAGMHIVHIVAAVPTAEWLDRLTAMARDQIVSLQSEMNIPGQLTIDSGDVRRSLVAVMQDIRPDVLVIGRGHVSSGARLGGSAYALVRDSPCPVVSV